MTSREEAFRKEYNDFGAKLLENMGKYKAMTVAERKADPDLSLVPKKYGRMVASQMVGANAAFNSTFEDAIDQLVAANIFKKDSKPGDKKLVLIGGRRRTHRRRRSTRRR